MAPAWPRQRTTVSLLTVVPGSKHTAGGGGHREGGGERKREGPEKKKGGESVCVFVYVCERESDAVRHTVI